MYIYIHIERERDRERERFVYLFMYCFIYVYIPILLDGAEEVARAPGHEAHGLVQTAGDGGGTANNNHKHK